MLLTGLLGFPVKHSLSPLIHSMFMDSMGVEGEYSLFSVAPEELEKLIERLGEAGFSGLNVTIPHKKSVFSLCSSTGPDAVSAGAVNTLIFTGNGLRGENTDVAGFRAAASSLPRPLYVLGSGGAAAAVHAAAGPENCISVKRGETLAGDDLPARATLVNATPLGWSSDDRFPVDVPRGWVFADLNYNPGWHWRNQLEENNVPVITGEVMLVEQAACSFSMWTGYTPSEELKNKILQRIRIEFNERNK